MSKLIQRNIEGYAHWVELASPILMGVLHITPAKSGSNPTYDLEQLWRRIVFNICVSNVDDHLRNHGFLLDQNGWRLSPAYDMNPNPNGHGLKLNISESDNAQDLALAKEVSSYFRIREEKAASIIKEIVGVVSAWHIKARRLKTPGREQDRMASAFLSS